ncbi:PREDICTED: brain-enriched guanylate kinase-associated protein [Colobus angolensis palliatus]|uniref:brain-enriched guanylate kinase-associated protein n=1 Tax=Colobus angolensis palliatus TaxID=336983 RepID=UPI0005F3E0B7|nr:PREDICTED: brain-enriched guanylate kinase-associated protein [Colobus angolensis palliatus]
MLQRSTERVTSDPAMMGLGATAELGPFRVRSEGWQVQGWAPFSALRGAVAVPPMVGHAWPLALPTPVLSSSVLFAHRLRGPWVPLCLGQPRVLQGRLARHLSRVCVQLPETDSEAQKGFPLCLLLCILLWGLTREDLPCPSLIFSKIALQEQKGELRKRLSYTTHKLEKLETEFDSTRHYLEIELRRAQEELEKVTEKLRRIQSNYMALQRINQELEDKLYRMGQHYEEEKRALSHEIVALNSHLLEAKVTIDKLSEDNELYRKDCNLAAQLLQCSQTYGRVHKVSELPSDFQERVSLHMEKHGCSLPSPLCHPAYADSVPTCVIAKVLEKPDPTSLSSRLSDASARDLAFCDGVEKPGPRPPYKGDIYCSDTALYCPEERRRDRRPSVDAPVTDVGFLRTQNSTDSAAEEEEEAEAAAFPAGFQHEAFPSYAGSLPTSSSYSSFSATSEEKEHAQASTLTASQQAIYLNSRDELFDRKPPAATYEGSPRFAKATAAVAAPLEAEVAPGFGRTMSPYPAETFRFPASPGPQQALMPPNLWSLRAKAGTARLPGEDMRSQWRPLSVEDIGAYSYPVSAAGRASPCSFSERYYGGAGGSPGKKADGRASPLYASYKADSFSEGDDLSQGRLAEPCFLRAGGDLSLSPGRSADPLPGYAPSEAGDGDRLGVQLCGAASSPEPEQGSRDSLEPSSMEASPEMHPAARLSPQQAFPRTGGTGLSRKDSLTKAQLYGTLLN